jgi:hypothetical protein
MDAIDPPGLDPPRDPAGAQPGLAKLRPRDHSVLSRGDPGDDSIARVDLLPHTGHKSTPGLGRPLRARRLRLRYSSVV